MHRDATHRLMRGEDMKNWKERLTVPEGNSLVPRTLAEVYGTDRLLVEHHKGIVSYATACIRIAATYGFLVVEGDELRLCCMSRSQLVIRGRIHALRMEGGG